jgi:hypothetical protein
MENILEAVLGWVVKSAHELRSWCSDALFKCSLQLGIQVNGCTLTFHEDEVSVLGRGVGWIRVEHKMQR